MKTFSVIAAAHTTNSTIELNELSDAKFESNALTIVAVPADDDYIEEENDIDIFKIDSSTTIKPGDEFVRYGINMIVYAVIDEENNNALFLNGKGYDDDYDVRYIRLGKKTKWILWDGDTFFYPGGYEDTDDMISYAKQDIMSLLDCSMTYTCAQNEVYEDAMAYYDHTSDYYEVRNGKDIDDVFDDIIEIDNTTDYHRTFDFWNNTVVDYSNDSMLEEIRMEKLRKSREFDFVTDEDDLPF